MGTSIAFQLPLPSLCMLRPRQRRIHPKWWPCGYCADLNFCFSKSSFSCCSLVASFCCINSEVPLVTPQASGLDIEGLYGLPEAIRRFCQYSFLALWNQNTHQDPRYTQSTHQDPQDTPRALISL